MIIQIRKSGGIWCSLYSLVCCGTWCHSLFADCLSGNDRPLLCVPLLPPGPLHLARTLFSSFLLNTKSSIISNNFSSKPWRLLSSCATFGYVYKSTADWEISKLPSHVTGFTVWCHIIQSGRSFCYSLTGTGKSGWQEAIKRQMLRHSSDTVPSCMDHLCP